MRFAASDLRTWDATPSLTALAERELPDFDPADPPFGFVFTAPETWKGDDTIVAIGTADRSQRLGVRISDGDVVVGGGRKATYVNASVPDFLFFLTRMAEFLALSNELDPDPPSMTLTVAESDDLLARFERGELRPRGDRDQRRRKEAELRRALRTLRSDLRGRDPRAVRASSWWGAILQEFADALP
jgi:hypothetical protein